MSKFFFVNDDLIHEEEKQIEPKNFVPICLDVDESRTFHQGKSFRFWVWEDNKHRVFINDDFYQDFVGYKDDVWVCINNTTDVPGTSSDWEIFTKSIVGPSAYDNWISAGNKGTVNDFIDALTGVSIVWKGHSSEHLLNPENGWCYRNTIDQTVYVFQDGKWNMMVRDGFNGTSIKWIGEFSEHPIPAQLNWCYKNTTDLCTYIYDGIKWVYMTADGASTFTTYNDNEIWNIPSLPIDAGTTNGWHLNPSSNSKWMSQKTSRLITEGEWGEPILIKGTGISEITKPKIIGLPGSTDTYTVKLNDLSEYTFDVYNGINGVSTIDLILTDYNTVVSTDPDGITNTSISNKAVLYQGDEPLNASFEWKTSSTGNNLDTSTPTNDGVLTISANTISNWKSDLVRVICYAEYNNKIYTKTWTITKVRDAKFELEYTDNKIKLFDRYSNTVSEIDASDFIKDGMLEKVEVVEITTENPIENYEEGTYLKFTWNNDGENKVTYIQANKIGKIYSGSDSINISSLNEISVKKANADIVNIKEIPVVGGPLSSLLNDVGITTISEGTDLQDLLMQLFCKEIWPVDIKSIAGTITSKTGNPAINITANASIVEPGVNIIFSGSQSAVGGYSASNASVKGLEYGYSTENDNNKDSDLKEVSKSWTISQISSNYELTLDGGSESQTVKGNYPMSIANYTIVSKIGDNICNANAVGEVVYEGTIEEIPILYGVSNLGKTSDLHKSDLLSNQNKTITSNYQISGSKTVTCVYPCYTNVKNNVFVTTSEKLGLQTNKTFTITSIPSEEKSNKGFEFEFPASKNISSVEVLYQPTLYNYYTNISGSVLSDVTQNKGNFKTTLDIVVPSEAVSQKHFVLEFPAQAEISSVTKLNTISGKYESIDNYEIGDVFDKSGDSYKYIKTTGSYSGESTYKFAFKTPTYVLSNDYVISEPYDKEINGENYKYKKMTTSGSQGIVSRKITLNQNLNIE